MTTNYGSVFGPAQDPPGDWSQIQSVTSTIQWEWPGWLSSALLTLCVGESGIGKSYIVLRICGCFTNGWPWPDGSPFTGEEGSVLWCEGEASQAVNVSRAIELGLDSQSQAEPAEVTKG